MLFSDELMRVLSELWSLVRTGLTCAQLSVCVCLAPNLHKTAIFCCRGVGSVCMDEKPMFSKFLVVVAAAFLVASASARKVRAFPASLVLIFRYFLRSNFSDVSVCFCWCSVDVLIV
jgi:hypothetical protein